MEKAKYNTLKNKYIGLGDADTKRFEFINNIKRDTYASLIEHDSTLEHLSLSMGKPKQIVRNEIIDKMARC